MTSGTWHQGLLVGYQSLPTITHLLAAIAVAVATADAVAVEHAVAVAVAAAVCQTGALSSCVLGRPAVTMLSNKDCCCCCGGGTVCRLKHAAADGEVPSSPSSPPAAS